MTDLNPQNPAVWSKTKGWIVGLTSVLVVLPSLVNAGIDVYKAILNIPRTDSERMNVELFKKYFNKPPVTAFPLPVKYSLGTVEAKFSIYEEGDIFVEYGKLSQWFPFPKSPPTRTMGSSFIAQAIAQQSSAARGIGPYQQTDRLEGSALVREKVYENGVVERQLINPRSGEILEKTTSPASKSSGNPKLAPFGVIDLDTQKARSPGKTPEAMSCKSPIGTCALLVSAPKGGKCACYTSAGPVPGQVQ